MSIYRDKKSGQWRFDFDRRVGGQRVRRRQLLPAGWSRAEAEAFDRKESAALWALAKGHAKPRRTIDEAVTCYLKERAPGLKHGLNVGRELVATRDWWSGRSIDDLHAVCAEYAADQLGALAPATIKNRIAYLRSACRWAWKRHGMAESDPGARVMVPTVRNARTVTASREEMLALAALCEHRGVRATIRCLWYSGMRLGELRAAERVHGAFVLWDTKNNEPRIVPIHPRIRSAAQVETPPRGALYYWWNLARELTGWKHITFHTMRHSTASEMINAGEDLATVGAVLGHKSPASTKRYSHWAVARLSEAMGKIGRRRPRSSPSGPEASTPKRAASS
jgi:integrase